MSWLLGWLGTLAGFGGASLAFLWPSLRGGFGAVVDIGAEAEIRDGITGGQPPLAYPAGRLWVVPYEQELDPDGLYAAITSGSGLMALYHKCPHLGCRVPWCDTSRWFECPCHGSRYNRWGEWQGGPAPRGMDRFALTVEEGRVIVDTSSVVTGPSRTAAVLDQPAEGPSCV
ncbi:MAG TPA: Rieske 2Fe-2S domain-containing protein [Egibacteraceae bacterium]|nr:Rieske 2Fe-2S domain-containing protein [Egibacteraceae bacterium]